MENNGLEKIIARITGDAQIEADEVIEKAKAEKERVLCDYRAKADEISAKYREKADAIKTFAAQKAESYFETAKRNAELDAKSEILERAFKSAENKLVSLGDDEYFAFLCRLLSSVIDDRISAEKQSVENGDDICRCDEFTVKLNARDKEKYSQKLLAYIKDTYPDIKAVTDENAVDINGGLIVCLDRLEANCSISMILSNKRDSLEREVAEILFGSNK